MRRLLFKVEDVFQVRDRGVVLTPGLAERDEYTQLGDEVELRRPDGSTVRAQIVAFELPSTGTRAILLEKIRKDDVPVGTEVWWSSSEIP